MNNVLRLPMNTKGRDIIVADPHGQFSLLKKALAAIQFDSGADRLIIAGDLVDKGKNSLAAAEWVKKAYCYGVIGNHDAQFIFENDSYRFSKPLICHPIDPWFVDVDEIELAKFCKILKTHLYPAIEIETAVGLVGVVHGEVPDGLSWADMVNRLNQSDYDLLHDCIWGRDIANKAVRGLSAKEQSHHLLQDVKYVFHGHSPSKKLEYYPYRLANRYYIDTAAYKASNPEKYPTAGITLFDLASPQKPLYTTGHRDLIYADERLF